MIVILRQRLSTVRMYGDLGFSIAVFIIPIERMGLMADNKHHKFI